MLLSQLYLKRLHYYQNRDEYTARVGQPPPPFDPTKRPKYWRDLYPIAQGLPEMEYKMLATGPAGLPIRHPQTGRPYLRTVAMWADEAAAVNLPTGATNAPGEDVPPVQVPLEPLGETQYLDWPADGDTLAERMALVVVRDRRDELMRPATWRLREQQLLERIAEKLGVTI